MKNLKKVLALALAFAMSLTLFAGAAYTDQTSIGADYADDVAMLSQLGVVGGYENGEFRPQNNITRAEASKLIYVLKYGSDDAGKLFSGAKSVFSDVEGNANVNWAKGYINYCYNQGIIGGKGAGKFDPNGNVTIAEFAKMLLVSLGCDAAKEGYGGSNWAGNVVADAMELGVFDGWAGDPTVPATREEACKLMRNTIFAPTYVYSALTGTGSQMNATGEWYNETLGEKTMGLKHIHGLVVANERYSLDRYTNGKKFASMAAEFPNATAPDVAPKDDTTKIIHEVSDDYADTSVKYAMVEIEEDVSDDLLGNIVDVYFKADGKEGAYTNVVLVGDVLVSNKTVAYDVMGADIEIMPNGESSSTREIKPYMTFTTADGEEKTVNVRTEYKDDGTADTSIVSTRVANNKKYDGAAFVNRIYSANVNPKSQKEATIFANPTVRDKAMTQMGENELRMYRFVSVDGGASISYILNFGEMAYGKVGTYNDTTIAISGAGGTLDVEEDAIIAEGVTKGMKVVTYMKDGKVCVEPTETITGKATAFYDKTATINGNIYRAAKTILGDEIDKYFTEGNGKNKNNENTEYVVYKNYILEVEATASVAGEASEYAVILYSKYDTETGVVTAKFGFPNNSEMTYEVETISNNEEVNENLKWNFINNRMVGAVVHVKIVDGVADLSGNDEDVMAAKVSSTAGVNSLNAISRVNDGMFKIINSNGAEDSYRADDSSIVFMLYGGKVLKGTEGATKVDENGNTVDDNVSYSAIRSKAYKLKNISDAAGSAEAVYVKIGGENVKYGGYTQKHYLGDAVYNEDTDSFSTLVAGSVSVGVSAGSGIGDMDNIAYILKAEWNYNTISNSWYIDVDMINHNGLISTRTIDNVTDDAGNIYTENRMNVGDDAFLRGEMVLYQMTESRDESDTREWIGVIGDNNGLGDYDAVYNYNVNPVKQEGSDRVIGTSMYDENGQITDGYYAVQIGIVEDNNIGFFPNTHYQTGEETNWTADMKVEETDKYNFAVIAIDEDNFVEGGDIDTISDSDQINVKDDGTGKLVQIKIYEYNQDGSIKKDENGDDVWKPQRTHNAIICVEGGEIVRVFSLYNNF